MGIGATTTTTATIVSMTIITKGAIAGRASSDDFSTESWSVGAGAVVSSVYEARSRERETVAEEIIVWS
jgi:hypothetical protein